MNRRIESLNENNIKAAETFLNSKTKKNQQRIEKKFSKDLKVFDHVSYLYFYLLVTTKNFTQVEENTPSRVFYIKYYLVPIVNGFRSIKLLLNAGLYSQVQVLLRTQIELINILVAFAADDDFFNHFIKPGLKVRTFNNTLTPKLNNADRAIKKMIFACYDEHASDFWTVYSGLRKYLYDDLSETAHGNISRMAFQSFSDALEKNVMDTGIGGVAEPIPFLTTTIDNSTLYFQLAFKFIFNQVIASNYMNKNNEPFECLDYYSSHFKINRKGQRKNFFREFTVKG
jgi:hypothetical protein